jgi:hypothetical protein
VPRLGLAIYKQLVVSPMPTGYNSPMRKRILSLIAIAFLVAVLAFPGQLLALARTAALQTHGAFMVIFIDAGNFLKGCF